MGLQLGLPPTGLCPEPWPHPQGPYRWVPLTPGLGQGNLGWDVLQEGFPLRPSPSPSQQQWGHWRGLGAVCVFPQCQHSAGAQPWHRPALLFTPSWHCLRCLQGPVGISSDSPSLAPAGTAAPLLLEASHPHSIPKPPRCRQTSARDPSCRITVAKGTVCMVPEAQAGPSQALCLLLSSHAAGLFPSVPS